MVATIKIDQAGLPAGTDDKSRSDGLATGALVTITNVTPGAVNDVTLEWVPSVDTAAVASLTETVADTTWTFTPSTNVYGSYRIRLIVDGVVSFREFSILTPKAKFRIPALNERANPVASLTNSGASFIAQSEFNENAASGPFAAGNYGGWFKSLEQLFLLADSIFGSDFKESVRVATDMTLPAYTRTVNVITADAAALPDIDGVTTVVGDSVLLKDGASNVDNGIYVVTQTGAPFILTRRDDFDDDVDVTSGALIPTSPEGTSTPSTLFLLASADPIVVNTDPIVFVLAVGSTTAIATIADVDLYVDPAGNDTNDGSSGFPLATLLEVDVRLPFFIRHRVRVHLSSGAHDLPARGFWLRSRVLQDGYIHVFADEAFDSAVYTQIATGTADAGTGQIITTVVGGGLAVDVWKNMTQEFTSGPADGWRQRVRNNTATDVIPAAGWDSGNDVAIPVSTNTFRIFEADGCTVNLPAGGPDQGRYQLAQQMLGGPGADFAATDALPGGLRFDGFRITASDKTNSWGTVSISGSVVWMYGVSLDTSLDTTGLVIEAGELFSGMQEDRFSDDELGLPTGVMYRGWGIRSLGTVRSPSSQPFTKLEGYIALEEGINIDVSPRSTIKILGGSGGRIFGGDLSASIEFNTDFGMPNYLIDAGASAALQIGGLETLSQAVLLDGVTILSMGAPILVQGAGVVMGIKLASVTRAASAEVIRVKDGGQLQLIGSPAGIGAGGAVKDWTIDGVAFDPLVLLANDGDVVIGIKGSRITRLGTTP